MQVALDSQANPVGSARLLFDPPKWENLQFQETAPFYEVMPDGQHFLMVLRPVYPSPTHYNVVLNRFEELKQKVPVP
jgi:hypothetical protein